VQHQHHGAAFVLVELAHQFQDLELIGDVEVGRGLVQQHGGRILGQQQRDPDALALATRQLVDGTIGQVEHPTGRQRATHGGFVVVGPLLQHLLVRIAPARGEVAHGDAVGCLGLLRQQPQPAGEFLRSDGVDGFAVEHDDALFGGQQPRHGTQQGGLAAGVRADDDRDLAVRDLDTQVVRDDPLVVGQGEFLAVDVRCCAHDVVPFGRAQSCLLRVSSQAR